MRNWQGYKCNACSYEIDSHSLYYTCSKCSQNLDVVYDYNKIRRAATRGFFKKQNSELLKKYDIYLPIDKKNPVTNLEVGNTPLYRLKAIEKRYGIKRVYGKDETRNPSSSFKDRASLLTIAKALEYKKEVICAASTGNAAASLACLLAGGSLECNIFIPEKAPIAKMVQLVVYGARIFPVKGSYDEAFDLSINASKEFGWYNRNTGYNPFTREGKKTCSYELASDTDFKRIDYIFIPAGDGNILTGIYKGFCDLFHTNIIDYIPKLVAVQSEKSASIHNAFTGDGIIRRVNSNTIADSISVSLPRDGFYSLTALKKSGGFTISVSDGEILNAIFQLAKEIGIFAEPAAAASYAGFIKAVENDKIESASTVVLLLTGHGLKDVGSIINKIKMPKSIEPDISALRKVI